MASGITGLSGAELKNNLKALWWQRVVRERPDVEGIDSAIIAHPRTWEASGHVEHFSDPMVDCRACKKRFRADQLDDAGKCSAREGQLGARPHRPAQLQPDAAPRRSARPRTPPSTAFLRAETCQPIFNDFKRVREAARQKIPFGIAQIGKAFRNEINPRNFTFRSREFEQAELEFFCHPSEREKWFEHWLDERLRFHRDLGFDDEHLRTRPHADDELAHYARAASRRRVPLPLRLAGDRGHPRPRRLGPQRATASTRARTWRVTDPETKEHYVPMVIETSVGVDRTCLGAARERLGRGDPRGRRHPGGDALPPGAGSREGGRPAAVEEARRARPRPRGGAAAPHRTSSTTTPATSGAAIGARTRRALRSA